MSENWFASWFDSRYYHILYKNRNEKEAEMFLDNLLGELNPAKNAAMLDLACGKGRHAVYMASKGYEVTGLDLSVKSIKAARRKETDLLSFYTHDMRTPFRINYYNYIFNLFTSFGYFETDREHARTLVNIAHGLRSGGVFVMDFFNAKKVIENLKPRQQKTVDGIRFRITRKHEDGFIKKKIRFEDKSKEFQFEERVRALDKKILNKMLKAAGLEPFAYFGDYNLNKYSPKNSDRLIILARKV